MILKSTVIIDEVVNIIKDYFDKEITEDSLATIALSIILGIFSKNC